MIAIGGAIGTGLFLGSASRLHSTGPALLLSYAVRRRHRLLPDARARRAGPAPRRPRAPSSPTCASSSARSAAFVTGWMYWLNWALTGIAELSAVGLYVQYWFPTMPTWATVLIALAVVLVDQPAVGPGVRRVRVLGGDRSRSARSSSSWSSALVVVIGGFNIGGHEAGFHNLWSNPGGFWPTERRLQLVRPDPRHVRRRVRLRRDRDGRRGRRRDGGRRRREVPKAVNAVIFRIARLLLRLDPAAGLDAADQRVQVGHQPVRHGLRADGPDLDEHA